MKAITFSGGLVGTNNTYSFDIDASSLQSSIALKADAFNVYTVAQVDSALSQKQDTITVGNPSTAHVKIVEYT